MRGDGLREAIELDEHGALVKPVFVDACGHSAREQAAACRPQCRDGELGIGGQGLRGPARSGKR